MELVNGISRWFGKNSKPIYLALGNFDGVHRGHQDIICTAVEKARQSNGYSAALIFDPHPSVLLRPECSLALLTDLADRAELVAALGLDYFIIEPFTDKIAVMSPAYFAGNILKQKLNVVEVVIGDDYTFGKAGLGSSKMMAHLGKEMGFMVNIRPLLRYNQKIVSSSSIRSLLLSGAVDEAADLLNYYFFRRGKVVQGNGIGAKMLYPTANIHVDPHLIQPGKGVYFTAITGLPGVSLSFGVTNVGDRPTFLNKQAAVETYILDFTGALYHRDICVYFLERIRDTRTFISPELLKEQISLDILKARGLIENRYRRLQELFDSAKSTPGPGLILKEFCL